MSSLNHLRRVSPDLEEIIDTSSKSQRRKHRKWYYGLSNKKRKRLTKLEHFFDFTKTPVKDEGIAYKFVNGEVVTVSKLTETYVAFFDDNKIVRTVIPVPYFINDAVDSRGIIYGSYGPEMKRISADLANSDSLKRPYNIEPYISGKILFLPPDHLGVAAYIMGRNLRDIGHPYHIIASNISSVLLLKNSFLVSLNDFERYLNAANMNS